jgi:uncharacterized protein Usg
MAMRNLELQLLGYRLTTAKILYRMPDHLALLQTYVWQSLDLAPKFPELTKFLRFWEGNLDGPLHSVTVASRALVSPTEFKFVGSELRLH